MPQSFSSLGAFRAHLAELIASAPAVERRAVEAGADHLLEAAKAIVGNYQSDPVAWPALAESTVEERVRLGFTPDEPLKRTGGFADSFVREVVDHRHAVVGTADERAAAFEYGHGSMPPRPVLAAADAQQGEAVAHIMAQQIHNHLRGRAAQD